MTAVMAFLAGLSSVGDAYSLSSAFGSDFSRMLVKGQDLFKAASSIRLVQMIKASFGSDPRDDACNQFWSKFAVAGQKFNAARMNN